MHTDPRTYMHASACMYIAFVKMPGQVMLLSAPQVPTEDFPVELTYLPGAMGHSIVLICNVFDKKRFKLPRIYIFFLCLKTVFH